MAAFLFAMMKHMNSLRRLTHRFPAISQTLCGLLFVMTILGVHLHVQHHHVGDDSSALDQHRVQIHDTGMVDLEQHQDIDTTLALGSKLFTDDMDLPVLLLILVLLLKIPLILRQYPKFAPVVRLRDRLSYFHPPQRAPPAG